MSKEYYYLPVLMQSSNLLVLIAEISSILIAIRTLSQTFSRGKCVSGTLHVSTLSLPTAVPLTGAKSKLAFYSADDRMTGSFCLFARWICEVVAVEFFRRLLYFCRRFNYSYFGEITTPNSDERRETEFLRQQFSLAVVSGNAINFSYRLIIKSYQRLIPFVNLLSLLLFLEFSLYPQCLKNTVYYYFTFDVIVVYFMITCLRFSIYL